jgi:hypothetical protein
MAERFRNLLPFLLCLGCGERDFDPVRPLLPPQPLSSLSVELLPVPAFVDLTAQGTLDWVHWGYEGTESVTRKRQVEALIGPLELVLPSADPFGVRPVDDDNTLYGWTDGEPTLVVSETPTGVYVTGVGASVSVSTPAAERPRRLVAHFGGWNARLGLAVELEGAEPVMDQQILRQVDDALGVPIAIVFSSRLTNAVLTVRLSVLETLAPEGNVLAAAAYLQ